MRLIKKELQFVPSRSMYYLHCPYFLKLSNTVKISIDEPNPVVFQKAQLFKNNVIKRISLRQGRYPVKVQRPIEIILNEGLLEFSKKLDVEFFATEKIGFQIGMFKPDLIETRKDQETTIINIWTIKNTAEPKEHHYLQSFVYKLALEKALKGTTIKPYQVGTSLIYWNNDFYHEKDSMVNIYQNTSIDLFVEEKLDNMNLAWFADLQKIATLHAQQDRSKCEACPGIGCCDVYNDIDFRDRYSWFRKFE